MFFLSIYIGPHVVHNHCELLEQDINRLIGEMSEVLTLFDRSHTTVPEPQHSQYEHSSTPAKSYKLGPMSEPDQIKLT
jgi:hypothetical protein